MRRLDPQYRLVFGAGGQLDATPNVERMERQIARLSPNEVWGLSAFHVRKLRQIGPLLLDPGATV